MINSSVKQTIPNRQVSTAKINKETALKAGDRVYLYGDPRFRGTLIDPLEKTDSRRWAVQLDSGVYDAVRVEDISVVTLICEETSEIPFSDNRPKISQQLREEIIALQEENELLSKKLKEAKHIIRRAKDISPIMRVSLKRVMRLAQRVCMDVQRTVGGWILRMGDKARKFRRLADIWDILSQDDWLLGEVFPSDRLIPINQIQPPLPFEKIYIPNRKNRPLMRPRNSFVAQNWFTPMLN